VQLVVTDRLQDPSSPDWSVYSGATLRVGDVQTKLQFLRAGLGFGSMPQHLVEQDLQAGALVCLRIDASALVRPFPIALVVKRQTVLGPAARWLIGEIEKL
jgi:DNA-binding transcriptional LysR family regulator